MLVIMLMLTFMFMSMDMLMFFPIMFMLKTFFNSTDCKLEMRQQPANARVAIGKEKGESSLRVRWSRGTC